MAGRERLRSSEIQLIQRVIDAYVAVRRDQALVKVYADQVTVLDQERRETEQRFAVRDVTRTDVAQAQGRLAAAQSQLATIEANLAISRAQYLDAVGQNPGDLAPEPRAAPSPRPDLDTTIGVAEQNSPVLRTARFTELASRAQVTEAKAEFNPSVGLQITGQRLPSSTLLPSPQIEAVTSALTLTQPLFSGGLRVSALRQARGAERQATSWRRTTPSGP
ncbi:MAG: TolC family protein [Caulobacteraceae bacterium]